MKSEKQFLIFMIFVFVFLITFLGTRLAHGDELADRRCAFAVKAAQVPPAVSLKLVCEKPFEMIEGDQVVTVDCRKYCKARGLKWGK